MSKATKSLSLQLKRKKQTFIVTLNTTTPKYSEIKKALHAIIQQVGGVSDPSASPADEDGDIPIPVPTYGIDSDESDDEDKILKNETPACGKIMPKLGEMVIGIPKDMSDVYGVGFKDVLDEKATVEQTVRSFSVYAFRLQDEKFDVIEPTPYDDDD